jgi:dTDP-4-dehydrorhamnose 3,5-epimerase
MICWVNLADSRQRLAPMNVIKTDIPEVIVFEPKMFGDARGFFLEHYHAERYTAYGVGGPFVQDNLSRSSRGVRRGLHIHNPRPQGKLVGVTRGRVLDVAVDIRVSRPTFGKHVAVELSDENFRQLWIPRGFAHGFTVLSDTADFYYKCDALYSPADEITVRWNDPALKIDWRTHAPTLSDRDATAPLLENIERLPRYERA